MFTDAKLSRSVLGAGGLIDFLIVDRLSRNYLALINYLACSYHKFSIFLRGHKSKVF